MAAAPTANPPLGSLVLTMGLIVVVMSGCVSPWKQTLPGTTPAPHYQEVPSNSPAPADNGSTSPTYQYRPYPVPDQLPDSTAPKIKTDRPYDGRDDETDRSVPLEELPASPKEGPENRDTPGWKPRVPDSSKVPDPIDAAPPNGSDSPEGNSEDGPHFTPQHLNSASRIEVDVHAPSRKQIGDSALFELSIRNPSYQPVNDVVVECEFDSTLAFPGKDGTRVRRAVGTLAAGETKKVVLSLSSGMVGRHCCRFSVMSGGIEVVWKSVCVEFVERNFDVEILGPTARTVGSRAEFVVKIVNRSKQELKDVNLVLRHDPQLVPREATEGACFTPAGHTWKLGNLAPREGLQLQVEFDCPTPLEQAGIQVEAGCSGLPEVQREVRLSVSPVRGLIDVKVTDRADSLRVGDNNEYVVTVLHRGQVPIRDVRFEAELPTTCKPLFVEFEQAGRHSTLTASNEDERTVSGSLDLIQPGKPLTVTVHARAVTAGDGEFRATLFPPAHQPPIEVRETTTVNR